MPGVIWRWLDDQVDREPVDRALYVRNTREGL